MHMAEILILSRTEHALFLFVPTEAELEYIEKVVEHMLACEQVH